MFLLTPAPFLKLAGKKDTILNYLMEYFPAYTESWKLRRLINEHIEKADDYEYTYPHLLLVAGNDSTERRIVRMTDSQIAGFEILTTTKERLLSGSKNIWLKPYEVDWGVELEYCELPVKYET